MAALSVSENMQKQAVFGLFPLLSRTELEHKDASEAAHNTNCRYGSAAPTSGQALC